jgi:hypothetical protein
VEVQNHLRERDLVGNDDVIRGCVVDAELDAASLFA